MRIINQNRARLAIVLAFTAVAIASCTDSDSLAGPTIIQPNLHPFEHSVQGVPPANIRAEHVDELFAGHVRVGQFGQDKFDQHVKFPNMPLNAVNVLVVSQDGTNSTSCRVRDESGYSSFTGFNWPIKLSFKRESVIVHGLAVGQVYRDDDDFSVGTITHDPETGLTVEHVKIFEHRNVWIPLIAGHLQETIPAVTYELCPDFPSPEELGMEVNHAQTAKTYPELVAQDPDERIIRPDLVSDNAIEPITE